MEKIFSLETFKNNICLEGESKQNAFFKKHEVKQCDKFLPPPLFFPFLLLSVNIGVVYILKDMNYKFKKKFSQFYQLSKKVTGKLQTTLMTAVNFKMSDCGCCDT